MLVKRMILDPIGLKTMSTIVTDNRVLYFTGLF